MLRKYFYYFLLNTVKPYLSTCSAPRVPTRGSISQSDVFAFLWSRSHPRKSIHRHVCVRVLASSFFFSSHVRRTSHTLVFSSVLLDDAVKSYTQKHNDPIQKRISIESHLHFHLKSQNQPSLNGLKIAIPRNYMGKNVLSSAAESHFVSTIRRNKNWHTCHLYH